MTGEPTKPELYVYDDINAVPPEHRVMRGGRLTLKQINEIHAIAHATGLWKTNENGDAYFIPDFGGARDRFEERNEVAGGVWVPRGEV